MARSTKSAVAAEICLYGTYVVGAGYIARAADGTMFGDGEPRADWSQTDAIFRACANLERAGVRGRVVIFAPGGQRMAVTDIGRPGTFGALRWEVAPVYTIRVDALVAAAREVA
jgi:hypothetical protein